MRKKGILGNFVINQDVKYTHQMKQLDEGIYAALITFLPGTRELFDKDEWSGICLASAGYKWLMYLPLDEFWCLSAYYTSNGELLGWYFDISKGNFLDEEGIPCTDDIFLDLAISFDGQTVTLDADELQEALDNNEISLEDYRHAYKIHDQILNSKWNDPDFLTELSEKLMAQFK